MKEKFIPHKTCPTPEQCNLLKSCWWASLIEKETGYVKDNLEETTSTLESVLRRAKCEHPQAVVAKEEAAKILESK